MDSQDKTVLVVTREEGHVHAYAPSLPGFSFGANTQDEFWRDVRSAVVWAGGKPDLTVYAQLPYETPEGVEWLLRVLQDDRKAERQEIARRIYTSIMGTEQRHELFRQAHPTPTGEYVFHCALFTDTIGSVMQALRPREDTVIVAAAAAEQLWYAQEIGTGIPKDDEQTLASLGLSMESTILDLMKADGAKEGAPDLHLGSRLLAVV